MKKQNPPSTMADIQKVMRDAGHTFSDMPRRPSADEVKFRKTGKMPASKILSDSLNLSRYW